MKNVLKWSTGCVWEGEGFVIQEIKTSRNFYGDKCPHFLSNDTLLVVVAFNEGGCNSTGVCVDCLKESFEVLSRK